MSEFNYQDEVNKIVCSLENEKNKILTWQKLISSIDFNKLGRKFSVTCIRDESLFFISSTTICIITIMLIC